MANYAGMLGLALEVILDKETGEERLGGVWDYRDDPEGIIFGGDPDAEKAARIQALMEQKAFVRLETLGYVVQPVEGEG